MKQHILVMENVLGSADISAIFDMKGSKLARKILKHDMEIPVEELPSYQTYKDLDFFQTQKQLRLSPADENRLKTGLLADVEMLRVTKVMDYSLLLAVGRPQAPGSQHMFCGTGVDQGKAYYIGIIDYLELYSTRKQIEGVSKSILHAKVQRDEISSVDSETYAKRFLLLIDRILPQRRESSQ